MALADFKKLSKRKNAARIISRDDFKRIHEESLRVLDTVGIRIYSPAALDLLKQHGADVDNKKMMANQEKEGNRREIERESGPDQHRGRRVAEYGSIGKPRFPLPTSRTRDDRRPFI